MCFSPWFNLCLNSKWVICKCCLVYQKPKVKRKLVKKVLLMIMDIFVGHSQRFFKGRYLEKTSSKMNNDVFKPISWQLCIQLVWCTHLLLISERRRDFNSISNTVLCEIVAYVEDYNFSTDSDLYSAVYLFWYCMHEILIHFMPCFSFGTWYLLCFDQNKQKSKLDKVNHW